MVSFNISYRHKTILKPDKTRDNPNVSSLYLSLFPSLSLHLSRYQPQLHFPVTAAPVAALDQSDYVFLRAEIMDNGIIAMGLLRDFDNSVEWTKEGFKQKVFGQTTDKRGPESFIWAPTRTPQPGEYTLFPIVHTWFQGHVPSIISGLFSAKSSLALEPVLSFCIFSTLFRLIPLPFRKISHNVQEMFTLSQARP